MYEDLLIYIAIGFLAQLVDGAIGMAYGITSTTVLLSAGVAPATASACVHAAETFTTAVSGFAHWRAGNVNFSIVKRLAIPGAIGGAIGAYILSNVDGDSIKPFISAYLLAMGAYVIFRALRKVQSHNEPPEFIEPLGFAGGFVDSIGGGGWGPVVTTTLLGRGVVPRYAIGSVNLAEFFVTTTISATFMLTIGLELWPIIAGLIIGGVLAAPLAAIAAKHIPARVIMVFVGVVVVGLSIHALVKAFA